MKPLIQVESCLYCKGRHFIPGFTHVKDRLGMSAHEWSFIECTSCGAALLSPRPDASDLESFYPSHYTFSVDEKAVPLFRKFISRLEYLAHYYWVYRSQSRIALKLTRKPASHETRLLDIGCGSGLLLREFKKLGLSVEGVDMRPEAVDYLKQKFAIDARVVPLEQLSANYAPDSLDIITLFHLVEHITNPEDILRQCYTMLKPGGAVVVAVPLIDSFLIRLLGKRSMDVTEAPRHVSLPSLRSVPYLARELGFERTVWHADAVMNCAAVYGLALFPEGTTTKQYGRKQLSPLMNRCLMALTSYLSTLLVWFANKILCRPHAAIFVAFKP